jgi:chromosome partitioning protein
LTRSSERRQYVRFSKSFPVSLRRYELPLSAQDMVEASCRNISASGMLLESPSGFATGAKVQTTIRIPGLNRFHPCFSKVFENDHDQNLVAVAEVVRSERASAARTHEVGVRFIDIRLHGRDQQAQNVLQKGRVANASGLNGNAAQILAIANQKGGVGKTTTALSLGAALARLKKKVLVLDMDPHACATIHLAYYPETIRFSSLDLFRDGHDDADVWSKTILRSTGHGFDFVPSHLKLSDLEGDLKGRPGKGLIISRRLAAISPEYDYIIIDCPPHVGVLLVNALASASLVVIPIQTDFLALHGLKLIFATIRMMNKALPHTIQFRALATMYDRRAGACRRVLLHLRKKLGERIFETVINTDTNFREASAHGKVILEHAPESRGSQEYLRLAREIVG